MLKKMTLALLIALQYLRGTAGRNLIKQVKSLEVRMQVGMGGVGYLRHAMSAGLERPVGNEEVEKIWADTTSGDGPNIHVTADEHIQMLTRLVDQVTASICRRSWHRVRFTRRPLAISDSPVSLLSDPKAPAVMGVGLLNAGAITVALDRFTLLMLADFEADCEIPPSTDLARIHNRAMLFGAERFTYFHPADDPVDHFPLPRPVRKIAPPNIEDFANRDRDLQDVLEQIEAHDPADQNTLLANYKWPIPGYVFP